MNEKQVNPFEIKREMSNAETDRWETFLNGLNGFTDDFFPEEMLKARQKVEDRKRNPDSYL